ncbi:MAG: Smr/MutS family protein [Syntrophaceae bacterium]|nr:Smr/MutS family protein [Syntrophaceae bacterium]
MDNNSNRHDKDSPSDYEMIEIPINGTLDLHTFDPRQLANLLDDYFDACIEKSIFDVRIIHGKGVGTLKSRVWSILKKHPKVESFEIAPLEAGSWGATSVRLREDLVVQI